MKQPLGTFYKEVWRTERQLVTEKSGYHRVGCDGWPDQELVRFHTSQHMGYAGRDVVERKVRRTPDGRQRLDLTVDCMGLTGARGALPAHYSEFVLSQLKQKAPALRDFFDLFNHRLISLFYRSWEKTQPAVHQEREGEDIFTRILRELTGSEESWEIYYGGILGRGIVSASVIQSVLSDITGMEVILRTHKGRWVAVSEEDQSQLPGAGGSKGRYATIGTAMIGSRVWMADKGADVVFYAGSREKVMTVLPGGQYSQAVRHMSGRMIRSPIRVRHQLVAKAADLPGARLASQGRLGADSFIGARPGSSRVTEVSFKPGRLH